MFIWERSCNMAWDMYLWVSDEEDNCLRMADPSHHILTPLGNCAVFEA